MPLDLRMQRPSLYLPRCLYSSMHFKDKPPFGLNINYRSAVGKLNYLAQTTRPDIVYATHQINKYLLDPRQSHGKAILYLVCYLKKRCDLGLKFKLDPKS
jgi:hypothetical protein